MKWVDAHTLKYPVRWFLKVIRWGLQQCQSVRKKCTVTFAHAEGLCPAS